MPAVRATGLVAIVLLCVAGCREDIRLQRPPRSLPPEAAGAVGRNRCATAQDCVPGSVRCADGAAYAPPTCIGGVCLYRTTGAQCKCFDNDIQYCSLHDQCPGASNDCRVGVMVCHAPSWGACQVQPGCPREGDTQVCQTGDARCPVGKHSFTCKAGWGACQRPKECAP